MIKLLFVFNAKLYRDYFYSKIILDCFMNVLYMWMCEYLVYIKSLFNFNETVLERVFKHQIKLNLLRYCVNKRILQTRFSQTVFLLRDYLGSAR